MKIQIPPHPQIEFVTLLMAVSPFPTLPTDPIQIPPKLKPRSPASSTTCLRIILRFFLITNKIFLAFLSSLRSLPCHPIICFPTPLAEIKYLLLRSSRFAPASLLRFHCYTLPQDVIVLAAIDWLTTKTRDPKEETVHPTPRQDDR